MHVPSFLKAPNYLTEDLTEKVVHHSAAAVEPSLFVAGIKKILPPYQQQQQANGQASQTLLAK